jgi:hypothetical protein
MQLQGISHFKSEDITFFGPPNINRINNNQTPQRAAPNSIKGIYCIICKTFNKWVKESKLIGCNPILITKALVGKALVGSSLL